MMAHLRASIMFGGTIFSIAQRQVTLNLKQTLKILYRFWLSASIKELWINMAEKTWGNYIFQRLKGSRCLSKFEQYIFSHIFCFGYTGPEESLVLFAIVIIRLQKSLLARKEFWIKLLFRTKRFPWKYIWQFCNAFQWNMIPTSFDVVNILAGKVNVWFKSVFNCWYVANMHNVYAIQSLH